MKNFLELYKELEGAVRDNTDLGSVLDYENTLEGVDYERLKVCRIIRNYVQHNSDGESFLAATPEMAGFLNKLIKQISSNTKKVRSVYSRVKALEINEPILNFFINTYDKKLNWFPVVDNGKLVAIIDKEMVFEAIGKKKTESLTIADAFTKKILKESLAAGKFYERDDDATNIDYDAYNIVVEKNIYQGIIYI